MERRISKSVFVLALVVVMLALSACAAQNTPMPATAILKPADATEPVAATDEPTALPEAEPTAAPVDADLVSFASDVMPILQNSCWKCHGGDKTEKGFDVGSYATLMAGSEKGAMVVPGDAANSKFYTLIEQGKMPKRADKLPDDQIQLIRDWVNQGALDN
jgi:mono/diheme cytochrome c family protein